MAKAVKLALAPFSKEIQSLEDLGKHIMYQRTKLQLSRQSAADLCGINYKTLENIEKANENVRVGNLLQVINMLGLNLVVEDK